MKAFKEIIGLLTDIREELRKFNAPAQPKETTKPESKPEPAPAVNESINALFKDRRVGRRSTHVRWTDEEEATIIEGMKKGLTYERIARTLPGRTCQAVADRVRKMRSRYSNQ